MRALVKKSVPADAEFLAPRLREADVRELQASGYSSALHALKAGLKLSDLCRTGFDPETGEPAVLFGVVRTMKTKTYNTIWLLGSDALERHGRLFARSSKRLLPVLLEQYRRVGNFVDTRNTVSMNWLLWLGFQIRSTVETDTTTFAFFLKERDE